jgi:hypothetical protein
VISSGTPPIGEVGYGYDFSATAAGGTTPYTFSAILGTVPAGTNLNSASGEISGTPTTGGTSSFTLQVQDSSTPIQTATVKLSVQIKDALSITTTNLPTGTVGASYSFKVAATGGFPPYTFAASGLPAGLVMSTDGTIKGVPTAPTINPVSVFIQVTDTNTAVAPTVFTSLNLTIINKLTIPATTLREGVTGYQYPSTGGPIVSQTTIPATGGTFPYNFTVSSGTLPPGLSLSQDIVTGLTGQIISDSALISGAPNAVGTYTFTLNVTDSSVPQQTANRSFTLNVVQGVQITTTSLPVATIGVAYSAKFVATGGTGPYTFSASGGLIVNGAPLNPLPPGLVLHSNGTITGTTTGPAGTYQGAITVTDSSNPTLSATVPFTIVVQ